jgi:mycothiol synthase
LTPVEVRRLTPADMTALSAAVERARAAGELRASSDPDARFFLRVLEGDPGQVALAWGDGGELLGFASSEFKLIVVEPSLRRRGIGRQLIGALDAIERERGRPDVIIGVWPGDADGVGFLRATGFAYHSTLWDMTLPPDREVPEPAWPDGLRARAFDRTRDLAGWVSLFNAAFADHATPLQMDLAVMTAEPDDPNLVDADILLVDDPDDAARFIGFCATDPDRRDGTVAKVGEIWTVGVRPERQGLGLGRQLLRWGVGRLRALGVETVKLSVNGRNERALGLYEREGFVRTATRERWARPVLRDLAGESSS